MGNKVQFYSTTSDKFNLLLNKNPNAIYFIEDLNLIYKGDQLYTKNSEIVSELPQNPVIGRLYYLQPSMDGYIWNNTEWINISITKKYIEDLLTITVIEDNESDN